jgi:membrane protein implicated in regulation of membrane protease activity
MIEYLSLHLWQIWAVLAVVCLILELTAGDFFILCFSIGAASACLTDALGGSITLQLVVFSISTLACLFFVRPFAQRFLHKGGPNRPSNADALIGRKGRVVETVKASTFGRVQIDGDIWKAVTNEANDIAEGTTVCVVSRASTIITVETIK